MMTTDGLDTLPSMNCGNGRMYSISSCPIRPTGRLRTKHSANSHVKHAASVVTTVQSRSKSQTSVASPTIGQRSGVITATSEFINRSTDNHKSLPSRSAVCRRNDISSRLHHTGKSQIATISPKTIFPMNTVAADTDEAVCASISLTSSAATYTTSLPSRTTRKTEPTISKRSISALRSSSLFVTQSTSANISITNVTSTTAAHTTTDQATTAFPTLLSCIEPTIPANCNLQFDNIDIISKTQESTNTISFEILSSISSPSASTISNGTPAAAYVNKPTQSTQIVPINQSTISNPITRSSADNTRPRSTSHYSVANSGSKNHHTSNWPTNEKVTTSVGSPFLVNKSVPKINTQCPNQPSTPTITTVIRSMSPSSTTVSEDILVTNCPTTSLQSISHACNDIASDHLPTTSPTTNADTTDQRFNFPTISKNHFADNNPKSGVTNPTAPRSHSTSAGSGAKNGLRKTTNGYRIQVGDVDFLITKGSAGSYKVRKSTKSELSSESPSTPRSAKGKKPSYQKHPVHSWDALFSKYRVQPKDGAPEVYDYASLKLRYILHQLNRGELPIEDLKKNLEYAALVLETAYMDETRRICEEDDEDLSEVSPDSVPEEVREWLTSTFTRQVQMKPIRRFKSVANAIRTGIMFDKIFRRMSGGSMTPAPIPESIQPHLRGINRWDFDIFALNEVSDQNALKYVGFELFNRYGLLNRFKIPHSILEKFLLQLQMGYSKHNNPYHNLVHGADVTQTCSWMLSQTGIIELLSELEVFACLFSSMIHDYEHTGHTNNFHVQSYSDFALLYNDRSVLENHHLSASFRLLKENDKNVLAYLTREEFREFRNLVVEMVLSTDMSTHFLQVKTMKSMLTLPESIDKVKCLCLMVHCCDISHPAKPWNLHHTWTLQVIEEFFRQGDLEASMGLPYSPLCDRNSVHVAESQIGFIDFIVEPSMMVCGEMLIKMVEPLVAMPVMNNESMMGDGDGKELQNGAVTNGDTLGSNLSSSSGSSRNSSSKSKLPLSADGKLNIPQPWVEIMHVNKQKWKEQAAKDEERRKKEAAA